MLSQVISLSLIFGSVPTSAIAYDGAYLICTDLAYDVMQQSIANGLPESQARDQYEKDLDRCRKEYDGRSKQSLSIPRSDRDPKLPSGSQLLELVARVKPAEGCRWVGKIIICPPVVPEKPIVLTQASDPTPECPPGTEAVTFSDGSKGCISAETRTSIEPPPETPTPRTTVSGGGNA